MGNIKFILVLIVTSLLGCSVPVAPKDSEPVNVTDQPVETLPVTPPSPAVVYKDTDIFKLLPAKEDQLKLICKRPGTDRVKAVFCAGDQPSNISSTLKNLTQLRNLLGLDPAQNTVAFALTAHSSSLVSKDTSAINPRAVIFHKDPALTPDYATLGFVPGEQLIEIAVKDSSSSNPNTNLKFYLLTFKQACNTSVQGCTHGDLFGPAVQDNWTEVALYESEDLKNTALDCLQCHQPEGPTSPRMLRMQELKFPWTHWISNATTGGQELMKNYLAMRSGETYASIPADQIQNSDPEALENLVKNAGFANQPNEFLSEDIENEVIASAPQQPAINIPYGQSAAWDSLFAEFIAGKAIRPPYHDVKISDPTKLESHTNAYLAFKNGAMSGKDLPDIRKIHFEPQAWKMGYAMKPGSTAQELLMQACGQCHNSRLDQGISRSRFNVDLPTMSRAEKDAAIARLNLEEDDLFSMPPRRFWKLTAYERALLKSFLSE